MKLATQIHRRWLQSRPKHIKVSEDGESTTYAVRRPRRTLADRALQLLSLLCFWRVSAAKAKKIVMRHTGRPRKCITLYSTLQDRWSLYCYWNETDCWYAEVEQDEFMLVGTSIVGVSKKTGKIVVTARANDEG
jgi:hypothetical protein